MKIYTRYITHTHVQTLNILSKILADIGFNSRRTSIFMKDWWILSLNSGSLWKWQILAQNQYEPLVSEEIKKHGYFVFLQPWWNENSALKSLPYKYCIPATSSVWSWKFSTYPWYHGYMSAPGTLEWLNPSEWPISWAATENRLVPAW